MVPFILKQTIKAGDALGPVNQDRGLAMLSDANRANAVDIKIDLNLFLATVRVFISNSDPLTVCFHFIKDLVA